MEETFCFGGVLIRNSASAFATTKTATKTTTNQLTIMGTTPGEQDDGYTGRNLAEKLPRRRRQHTKVITVIWKLLISYSAVVVISNVYVQQQPNYRQYYPQFNSGGSGGNSGRSLSSSSSATTKTSKPTITVVSTYHGGGSRPSGSRGDDTVDKTRIEWDSEIKVDPDPSRLQKFDPYSNSSNNKSLIQRICPTIEGSLTTHRNETIHSGDISTSPSSGLKGRIINSTLHHETLQYMEGSGGYYMLRKISGRQLPQDYIKHTKKQELQNKQKRSAMTTGTNKDPERKRVRRQKRRWKKQLKDQRKDYELHRNRRELAEVVSSNHGQDGSGDGSKSKSSSKSSKTKILCLVYTIHSSPWSGTGRGDGDGHSNVQAQSSTWGHQCDGFLAFSNVTQDDVGAIRFHHQGQESYGNMWQKIRSMWMYAYRHYVNDYDYFHVCGDDAYVHIPNMRTYLDGPEVYALEYGGFIDGITEQKEKQRQSLMNLLPQNTTDHPNNFTVTEIDHPPYNSMPLPKSHTGMMERSNTTPSRSITERTTVVTTTTTTTTTTASPGGRSSPRPLLLGIPMQWYDVYFPAGGPGYTLNREALRLFGTKIFDSCMVDTTDSREDLIIGTCFADEGVYISDTRNKLTSGTRYGESAQFEYKGMAPYGSIPNIGISYNKNLGDRSSDDFFAFHLKTNKRRLRNMNRTLPELIYRYYTVLHGMDEELCKLSYATE